MSSRRAKDVSFSTDAEACQTMVLDLEPASTKKTRPGGEEVTMVLDLSSTQIHKILADTDAELKRQARSVTR